MAALVRSQVKVALRKENVRAWHEVEADFNEVEYRAVRDRQMRELEKEDDVMSKGPVRYVVTFCLYSFMLNAGLAIQEYEGEVVQGVIRVREAAADTLFDAGRVVYERDATL